MRKILIHDRLGILFLVAFFFSRPGYPEDAGRVVAVVGKVLLRYPNSENPDYKIPTSGEAFRAGAVFNTASNGGLKLLLKDKTVLDLGPASVFSIDEFVLKNGSKGTQDISSRSVALSLDYGTVRASVNEKIDPKRGKFTLRTKSTVLGVRGTEFLVEAPQGSIPSVAVTHGLVEIAQTQEKNQKPIEIAAGYSWSPAQTASINGVTPLEPSNQNIQKMDSLRTGSLETSVSQDLSQKAQGDAMKVAPPQDLTRQPPGSQAMMNAALNEIKQGLDRPLVRPIDFLNGQTIRLKVSLSCGNASCK